MDPVDKIERTILLPVPRERVWRAITQPAELSKWFARECDFTLEVGSSMTLTWASGPVACGVIEVIEPPQRFAFRWHAKPTPYTDPLTPENSTLVTFTLEEIDSGTQVTVTETGFATLPQAAREHVLAENTSGWRAELQDLVDYFAPTEAT
jgi:uncharacterized protein YndB with AHSA1/START domain